MNLEARKPRKDLTNKDLTERIIAAAIRVHRELGPGFLEGMYEEALGIELTATGIFFERQKPLPIFYREHLIGEHRLDFLVEGRVIVELKAISALENILLRNSPLVSQGVELAGWFIAKFREHKSHNKTRWSRISSSDRDWRRLSITFMDSWFPDFYA